MQTITKIVPQKNKKRVNIFLDGKFAFGIDLENFMKLNLKVGRELTENEVKDIVSKSEYAKTLEAILKFATVRKRSEKEIYDWIKRKKVHNSLVEKLFSKLKHFDLVDDNKFADWWINQRLSFRPKSVRALTAELRTKGIDQKIIKYALSNSQIDEIKIANDLLLKKDHKWTALDKDKAKLKKSEYLARNGFGWDVIREVIGYKND